MNTSSSCFCKVNDFLKYYQANQLFGWANEWMLWMNYYYGFVIAFIDIIHISFDIHFLFSTPFSIKLFNETINYAYHSTIFWALLFGVRYDRHTFVHNKEWFATKVFNNSLESEQNHKLRDCILIIGTTIYHCPVLSLFVYKYCDN